MCSRFAMKRLDPSKAQNLTYNEDMKEIKRNHRKLDVHIQVLLCQNLLFLMSCLLDQENRNKIVGKFSKFLNSILYIIKYYIVGARSF